MLGAPLRTIRSFEHQNNLPPGSVGRVIQGGGSQGPWARLERGEIPLAAFYDTLDADAARAGHPFSASALLHELARGSQPNEAMVAAIRTIRASGLRVAALTNNWDSDDAFSTQVAAIGSEFDLVLESWRVGHRKPEQRIYELLLERLELPAPALLFLDDLGSNLKPARAMGMTTIHVKDITSALRELSAALGRPL